MENKKLEIKRKIFHVIGGLLLIFFIYLAIIKLPIIAALIVLILAISLLSRKAEIPLINIFLKNFERPYNIRTFPARGVFTFLSGAFLSLLLFEKNTALAALMILTVGDAVSSVSSLYFKKTKNRKTIYGTILAIIFSFFAAMIFIDYKRALIVSIIGMLVESIELRVYKGIVIDDNITVPLASGFVIYLAGLILFGG